MCSRKCIHISGNEDVFGPNFYFFKPALADDKWGYFKEKLEVDSVVAQFL